MITRQRTTVIAIGIKCIFDDVMPGNTDGMNEERATKIVQTKFLSNVPAVEL